MVKRAQFEVSAGLQELARQFEEWRSSHAGWRPDAGDTADAAPHLSFLPAAGRIAGAGCEAELAREREESWLEPHKTAISFSDGRRQVVVNQFPRRPAHRLKGVDVTPGKRLKALAVGELQIQQPTVRLDEREGVKLAPFAAVVEYAKVSPVDLEPFRPERAPSE